MAAAVVRGSGAADAASLASGAAGSEGRERFESTADLIAAQMEIEFKHGGVLEEEGTLDDWRNALGGAVDTVHKDILAVQRALPALVYSLGSEFKDSKEELETRKGKLDEHFAGRHLITQLHVLAKAVTVRAESVPFADISGIPRMDQHVGAHDHVEAMRGEVSKTALLARLVLRELKKRSETPITGYKKDADAEADDKTTKNLGDLLALGYARYEGHSRAASSGSYFGAFMSGIDAAWATGRDAIGARPSTYSATHTEYSKGSRTTALDVAIEAKAGFAPQRDGVTARLYFEELNLQREAKGEDKIPDPADGDYRRFLPDGIASKFTGIAANTLTNIINEAKKAHGDAHHVIKPSGLASAYIGKLASNLSEFEAIEKRGATQKEIDEFIGDSSRLIDAVTGEKRTLSVLLTLQEKLTAAIAEHAKPRTTDKQFEQVKLLNPDLASAMKDHEDSAEAAWAEGPTDGVTFETALADTERLLGNLTTHLDALRAKRDGLVAEQSSAAAGGGSAKEKEAEVA